MRRTVKVRSSLVPLMPRTKNSDPACSVWICRQRSAEEAQAWHALLRVLLGGGACY